MPTPVCSLHFKEVTLGTGLVTYTVGMAGVKPSSSWASFPAYENWEHVVESFQTILHCGNCFDFPLVQTIVVAPKAGSLQIFLQSGKVVTLEFIPESLASCRQAIMEYLWKVLARKLPFERPKHPAERSQQRSKVFSGL